MTSIFYNSIPKKTDPDTLIVSIDVTKLYSNILNELSHLILDGKTPKNITPKI